LLIYYDFWGLRRLRNNVLETVSDPFTPVIGPLSFLSVDVDASGRLLLSGFRLYRQEGSDWQAISPPGLEVYKMLKSPSGDFFFLGDNKIVRFDGVATWDSSDVYLPGKQYLFDICFDAAGDLFGVFYSTGSNVPEVWKFPQGDLSAPQLVVTAPPAYGYNTSVTYAFSIAVDGLGRIWLNVNGTGFHFIRWNGQTWTAFGGTNNGPFSNLNYNEPQLTGDADGALWMSNRYRSEPLFRLSDGSGFQPFGRSVTVQRGVVAPDGQIWTCGSRFVVAYNPETAEYRQFFPKNNTSQFWYAVAVSPTTNQVFAAEKNTIWTYNGQVWSLFYANGSTSGQTFNRLAAAPDGGIWATLSNSNGPDSLYRFDPTNGQVFRFAAPNNDNFTGLSVSADSAAWVAHKSYIFRVKNGVITLFNAQTVGYPFTAPGIYISGIKADATGQIWAFADNVGLIRRNTDGTWIAFTPQNSGLYAASTLQDFSLDAYGNPWISFGSFINANASAIQFFNGTTWKTYTRQNSNLPDVPVQNVLPAPDGKMWFVSVSRFFSLEFLPRWLYGNIRRDNDDDCQPDLTESPLNQWIVQATSQSDGERLYGRSFDDGRYELNLDSAVYALKLLVPAPNWGDCDVTPLLDLTQIPVDSFDFAGEVLADCPLLNLDIGVPFLRRCYSNFYQIRWCNLGSLAADSAFVDLFLPPQLTLQNMGLPYDSLGPQRFRVDIGSVAAGDCGQFTMQVLVDCDAEMGSTLCVSAAISPDTICADLPTWSGADLYADALCAADTVFFKIKNQGDGAMAQALEYVIIEDEVIMRTGSFQLPPVDSVIVPFPATSGYQRIQFPQEPGHPFFGLVSASIEGCGTGFGGWFFTNYPFEDPSPFQERECSTVISSFDPNDKAATPQGVGDEHFILPNTRLDYKIRFQNTGTDTAFTVTLRDTLSPWMDVATLQIGAASHPFVWDISGDSELTFRFDNILLPDSNTNEAASHGFVAFSIQHRADMPLGTVLENRAGIYFDFNAVVLTNTVFHTVDTGFLAINPSIAAPEIPSESDLALYPVPARDVVFIALKNPASQCSSLRLRNTLGQVLRQQDIRSQNTELRRGTLPTGWYCLEILDDDGAVVARRNLLFQ
jgi:sugar lactone lactonase YvrE